VREEEEVKIFQVDAFTDEPFGGNPAAVCLMEDPRDEAWMQAVAREMNLSETAFVSERADGFTPTVEADLCGHATLASAHVLWEEGRLDKQEAARFHTRSGLLTARREGQVIELDLPLEPATPVPPPPELEEGLGVGVGHVGQSRLDFLAEVDSEETVRGLRPRFEVLAALPARGVIVTAVATSPGFDYVLRCFAPQSGMAEDPVTGSAQCTLGPFWRERLGKDEMTAYQASARGGVLRVRVGADRVFVGGLAVTVLRGELI
jgi:PhzF family phenazine biosynthesis protein